MTCGKAQHRLRTSIGGQQMPAAGPLLCHLCQVSGQRGFNHKASGVAFRSVSPTLGSLSVHLFCFRVRTTVLCERDRFTPRTRMPRTPSYTRATST